jgi:excisionase family DNA binding protein
MDEYTYNVAAAAVYCGIAKGTIYKYRAKKRFPAGMKIGRGLLFSQNELDTWKSTHVAVRRGRPRKRPAGEQASMSI